MAGELEDVCLWSDDQECTSVPAISLSVPPAAQEHMSALYVAADLTENDLRGSGSWPDRFGGHNAELSGSGGRLVTNQGGHGASGDFAVLVGTTETRFRTPTDLFSSDSWTFFFLTRYSGGNRGRIMNGQDRNWLSGNFVQTMQTSARVPP